MAVNVGNLEATLGMDTKGFKDGVKEAEKGTKGIGASLSSLKTLAIGAAASIGAALVGLGAASLSAWDKIDESLDNIRVGTGATGEALAGLEDSFKAVFSSVPVDAADASTAIADLNTRLGLTGDDLETLATQFLELSRITGTNVGSNIKSVTRLFGDWSVATEDQADTLDYLFKTAQATGATVEQLATTATAYGTSLRGLGFDMETSIALLGKFEKEGVNTETIMGSLKIGMANMAKQGFHNADEAMEELIRQIKEFPDTMDATAASIEIFGSRSSADFTMAVREGRFEVEDFITTLSDSDETILKAADDTRDFAEQFKVLNNKITLALEPLGAMLAGIISTDIMPILEKVVGFVSDNMVPILVGLGTAIGVFAGLVLSAMVPALTAWAAAQFAVLAPFLPLIAVAVAVGAALYILEDQFGLITKAFEILSGVATWALDAIKQAFDDFMQVISPVIEWVQKAIGKITDAFGESADEVNVPMQIVSGLFEWIGGRIGETIDFIVALFEWVWPYIEGILDSELGILIDLIGVFSALFAGDWETLKDKLIDLSLDLMDLMYGVFELGFDAVLGLFVAIGNGINAVLTGAWNMVLGGLEAMINKEIDMLDHMIAAMNKIPGVNIPLIGHVSFKRAEAKKLEAPKLSDFTGGKKPTDKAREMIEAERAEKKRLEEAEKEAAMTPEEKKAALIQKELGMTLEDNKKALEEAEKEAAMTPEEKKAALIQKELGMTLEDNKKALEEANKKPTVPPMSATPTPTEIVQTDPIEIVTDKPVPVVGITDDVFQDLTAELKAFSFDAVVDAINNARDMLVAAITGGVDKTIAEEEELITDLVSEEEEITPATLGEKISQALSETFTNMSANGADFEVDTMSNMPLILNQDIHITTEIDGYEIGKAVYSTWNRRTGGGLNI